MEQTIKKLLEKMKTMNPFDICCVIFLFIFCAVLLTWCSNRDTSNDTKSSNTASSPAVTTIDISKRIKDIRKTSSGKDFYLLSANDLTTPECKKNVDLCGPFTFMLGTESVTVGDTIQEIANIGKTNFRIDNKDTYVISTYFGGSVDNDLAHDQIIQIDNTGNVKISEAFYGATDDSESSDNDKKTYSVKHNVLTILSFNKMLHYTFTNGVLTTIDNRPKVTANSADDIIEIAKKENCYDNETKEINTSHACNWGEKYCDLFKNLNNPVHDEAYDIVNKSCLSINNDNSVASAPDNADPCPAIIRDAKSWLDLRYNGCILIHDYTSCAKFRDRDAAGYVNEHPELAKCISDKEANN